MKRLLSAAAALLLVAAVLWCAPAQRSSGTGPQMVAGRNAAGNAATAAVPPNNAGGVVALAAVSLGENPDLNGFVPFPGSSFYDDISGAPVDAIHNASFQGYNGTASLHPDFIDPTDSLPLYVLNSATSKGIIYVPGHCTQTTGYCTQSHDTVLPFVAGMMEESGTDPLTDWPDDKRDHHLSILDQATGFLYDTYGAKLVSGTEQYYSATIWDVNKPIEGQHPIGQTSGDAAGLPVGLGLIPRYEEVAAGAVNHAMRITFPNTECAFYPGGAGGAFVPPATHAACNGGGLPGNAYMGMRLRLKAGFDISRFSPQNKALLTAMKKYGFIVADNGSRGFFQAPFDPRFNQADLNRLNAVRMSDFEVITTGASIRTGDLEPETPTGGTTLQHDQAGLDTISRPGPVIRNSGPPAIDTFKASATTVALGSPVTFTATASKATYGFIDNAGPLQFGSTGITVTPTQTQTYTLTALGTYGYTVSSPITVKVTGPTVVAPVFAPGGGPYTSNQTVTLSAATDGAAIHFTRDGSMPACSSPLYTVPFTVTSTETDRAIGCKAGNINSPITSATYSVLIPGGVPSVTSQTAPYGTEYTLPDSSVPIPVNFANTGSMAIISIYDRDTSGTVKGVTCNKVAGTALGSQINGVFRLYVYAVSNVKAGPGRCVLQYVAGGQNISAAITEVSGTSGIDTVAIAANFKESCPEITTTGPNRLGLVIGAASHPVAVAGFTQLYSGALLGAATLPLRTAGGFKPRLGDEYASGGVCATIALKP